MGWTASNWLHVNNLFDVVFVASACCSPAHCVMMHDGAFVTVFTILLSQPRAFPRGAGEHNIFIMANRLLISHCAGWVAGNEQGQIPTSWHPMVIHLSNKVRRTVRRMWLPSECQVEIVPAMRRHLIDSHHLRHQRTGDMSHLVSSHQVRPSQSFVFRNSFQF